MREGSENVDDGGPQGNRAETIDSTMSSDRGEGELSVVRKRRR